MSHGLTIATYNVKDLFDSVDEATENHLNRKLDALAAVVSKVNADVLGLQEVGSAAVLERLRQRLPDGGGYRTTLVGTADARGIRCALLSRLPVRTSEVLTADHLEFPKFYEGDAAPFGTRIPLRRGVVHAEIDTGTLGIVHALVLHFKSVRPVPLRAATGEAIEPRTARERAEGELRTLVWRASEALFVRGVSDELLERNPGHHLAVMGDFNDLPASTVLRIARGDSKGDGETELHSVADAIATTTGRRFSVLHRGARLEIDHMLLSPALRAKVAEARFFNDDLRDHGALEDPYAPTIDSDHAPLVVRFTQGSLE